MIGDPRVPTDAEKLADAATVVRDALLRGRCKPRVANLSSIATIAMLDEMIQGVALADTSGEGQ